MNPFLLTVDSLATAKIIDKNFKQLLRNPLPSWGHTNQNKMEKGLQKVFVVSVRTNIPYIQLCYDFNGVLRVTKV